MSRRCVWSHYLPMLMVSRPRHWPIRSLGLFAATAPSVMSLEYSELVRRPRRPDLVVMSARVRAHILSSLLLFDVLILCSYF
ncbi:hypothetical protein NDU88_000196 [Pleurodeles waltl]|uniref:Uncharacterized protein n=1 Tax=Pleurodeles waltl TaxID=8319 RepID=A0AAV7L5Q0_PLEWA|nr:hypothetical protein NDU88_000196 [Pleurodeles waltl]